MSGGHSDAAPPDPISNSEVKRISGDGSMGFPHARVAHRQTPITRKALTKQRSGLFRICASRKSNSATNLQGCTSHGINTSMMKDSPRRSGSHAFLGVSCGWTLLRYGKISCSHNHISKLVNVVDG